MKLPSFLRRPWRPVISKRATQSEGCRLHVLPSLGSAFVEHRIPVPCGACPVSGNPISGEVVIGYRPVVVVAEIVSLFNLVQFAARENPGTARSVEGLAKWLHEECGRALAVSVTVDLVLQVNPGPQTYRVTFGG